MMGITPYLYHKFSNKKEFLSVFIDEDSS